MVVSNEVIISIYVSIKAIEVDVGIAVTAEGIGSFKPVVLVWWTKNLNTDMDSVIEVLWTNFVSKKTTKLQTAVIVCTSVTMVRINVGTDGTVMAHGISIVIIVTGWIIVVRSRMVRTDEVSFLETILEKTKRVLMVEHFLSWIWMVKPIMGILIKVKITTLFTETVINRWIRILNIIMV